MNISMFYKFFLMIIFFTTTSCVNPEESETISKQGNNESYGSGKNEGSENDSNNTPSAPNTIDVYTEIDFSGHTSFDTNLQSMFNYPLDPDDVNNVTVSGGKMTLSGGTSVSLSENISNNSIIDLSFSRSYGSSSADGREALMIYPTAAKDTLSRSPDGLPLFPSLEAFGFYTFSSSYNVRMWHNINNTGTYNLRFDSHRIYIPDSRGNGGRLWRVRFVMRNGSLKGTLNWQSTNTNYYGQQWVSGFTSEPNILTMDLPNSFDYNNMTFELIGNRSINVFNIKVSELLECIIPNTIPTGYNTSCLPGELNTELECSIACDTTTHKIDSTHAFPILTCSTEGEDFVFNGCIPQ